MAAMTNFLENRLIDQLFRGQAYTFPATLHIGLFTAAPSDAGGGTEVVGGGYARVSVAATLANWAGTQAPGSTVASNGSNGTTSNNIIITFPQPTANWGSITSFGIFDAATAGNLMIFGALNIPKTVNNGDAPPSFAIGALTFQVDN